MCRLLIIRNADVAFLTQDILQPQAFHLPAFEQGHAVVPAELKGSCWGELRRPGAFYNLYESYGTTLRWRYTYGWQEMVLRIDRQYSILKSQVSFRAPGSVCSDGNKRAIRPRLHPPCAAGEISVNSTEGLSVLFWKWHPRPARHNRVAAVEKMAKDCVVNMPEADANLGMCQ
jgi:hypothetical protein